MQRLFNIATAIATMSSVAICVLWVGSYRVITTHQFTHDRILCEVVSVRGNLTYDDVPQRDLEAARAAQQWDVLARECMRLNHDHGALRNKLKDAGPDERSRIESQLAALQQDAAVNAIARAAFISKLTCTTPLVTHSAPHALFAAAFGLPVIAWSVLAILASRRRKTRRANCLCARCGYDLRASTGRCPECGTAISHAVERPTARNA